MLHFLFSFNGRVNRAKFWAFYLGAPISASFVILAVLLAGSAITGTSPQQAMDKWTPLNWPQSPLGQTMVIAYWAGIVLLFYCLLAIVVKRLHDRNKSAWWLAFFYGVPITSFAALRLAGYSPSTASPQMHTIQLGLFFVNTIIIWWYLIEILFLPGKPGENRFGPDPRAKRR